MTDNLKERYIYAVTKRMPDKMKKDVAAELNTLIEDMLEERSEAGLEGEAALKAVLTELGTPEELYGKYTGSSEKCLIGAPYYTVYIQVLKLVLACTAFGMTVAEIVDIVAVSGQVIWYIELLQWLGMLFGALGAGFAYVTLLFAFLYHKNIRLHAAYDFDALPEIPKENETFSRNAVLGMILFIVLFLCIFLCAPQLFCAYISKTGERIPVFDIEIIRKAWYFPAAFACLGLLREIVKLIEGSYTKRFMYAALAVDFLSAVTAAAWLLGRSVMNPQFLSRIHEIFPEEGTVILDLFTNFQYFLLGVMLFALLLDAGTAVFKGLRSTKVL